MRLGRQVIIRQLAVDPAYRGQGLAHRLVGQVRELAESRADGVGAWCPLSAPASQIWPHLGFVPFSTTEFRDFEGNRVMFWWLDTTQPDFFEAIERPLTLPRRRALLESELFFALVEGDGDLADQACLLDNALVHETVELVLDPKVQETLERKLRRPGADTDELLRRQTTLAERFTRVSQGTKTGAPDKLTGLSKSTGVRGAALQKARRLLNLARQEGVQVVLTAEETLLSRQHRFYEEFGIEMLGPRDLVNRPAEFLLEDTYCPARLNYGDVDLQPLSVPTIDVNALTDIFRASPQGETRPIFAQSLGRYCREDAPSRARCLRNAPERGSGHPEVLLVEVEQAGGILAVPLLRFAPGMMRGTLIRQVLWELQRRACGREMRMIIVQDGYLDPEVLGVLEELDFQPAGTDQHLKILMPGLWRSREVVLRLENMVEDHGFTRMACQNLTSRLRPTDAGVALMDFYRAEHQLYPLRISNVDLPVYLASISGHLAGKMLSAPLGSDELFEGGDRRHVIPREGVLFESRKLPRDLAAPGRILWLLQDTEAGALCAISNLERIEVADPEEFILRYRRLGIYDAGDIHSARDGKAEPVTAFCFSNTWLLPHPLDRQSVMSALRELENRTRIEGVTRLRSETFQALFGRSLEEEVEEPVVEPDEW
jgi:predicted GNAT family acetyltransferase